MTKSPLILYKLQATLFESHRPNSDALIRFLTQTINDGYNFNKKYNIITSKRVKNDSVFVSDLGFHNKESFIYVLIKTQDYNPKQLDNVSVIVADEGFRFDEINQADILGTIGGKPHIKGNVKGLELTGFTSKVKGIGKFLINFTQELAIREKIPFLFCAVIAEHHLAEYYAQYGFVEEGEQVLQRIDETGLVQGDDLEDETYALQDFHIAFLRWTTPQ